MTIITPESHVEYDREYKHKDKILSYNNIEQLEIFLNALDSYHNKKMYEIDQYFARLMQS